MFKKYFPGFCILRHVIFSNVSLQEIKENWEVCYIVHI